MESAGSVEAAINATRAHGQSVGRRLGLELCCTIALPLSVPHFSRNLCPVEESSSSKLAGPMTPEFPGECPLDPRSFTTPSRLKPKEMVGDGRRSFHEYCGCIGRIDVIQITRNNVRFYFLCLAFSPPTFPGFFISGIFFF